MKHHPDNMDKKGIAIVPLEPDELIFIREKLFKERREFFRVLRWLVVLGLVIPLSAMAFFNVLHQDEAAKKIYRETHFHSYYFLVVAGILLLIILFAAYVSYRFTIGKIALDAEWKQKVVERTKVLRKVFMPPTNTYHFYLDSDIKLSIEVSMEDYAFYQEGDEINIEYSRYANEYLGYF